jgi:hypothetical protein
MTHETHEPCLPTLPVPVQELPVSLAAEMLSCFNMVIQQNSSTHQTQCQLSIMETGEGGVSADSAVPSPHAVFAGNKRLAKRAGEPGQVDIHEDEQTLALLRMKCFHVDTKTPIQIKRVTKRAKGYRVRTRADGQCETLRVMLNGAVRVVPPLREREEIIKQAHNSTGHWGMRRTSHLLLANYWWQGIQKDVATIVGNCEVCVTDFRALL